MVDMFNVGQIVNAVGIKGELKVYPLTDYKERFDELEFVYIEGRRFDIERVRYNNELVILKLKGIDDRTTAEKYKTLYLKIDRENARKLPEGTYFIVDLIGCEVYSTDGSYIGTLTDVIQSTAQDLYEIKTKELKNILVPAVEEFVKEIDIEKKMIKIQLIEGLMDL
ncbi:MAG: 16S rRNA processing protein RimM [Clostridiales bacterium]|nr:16S rRNA processing protein RimM [Clostridiales bacterium]